MHDATAMGLAQGFGNLDRIAQDFFGCQRPVSFSRRWCQPIRECLAFQVLHDQEVDAGVLTNVVEGADVRVIEARDGPGFALEALLQIRIVQRTMRQHLDGDGAIEPRVAGPIDLSHSSCPDGSDDFVGPEAATFVQRHSAWPA